MHVIISNYSFRVVKQFRHIFITIYSIWPKEEDGSIDKGPSLLKNEMLCTSARAICKEAVLLDQFSWSPSLSVHINWYFFFFFFFLHITGCIWLAVDNFLSGTNYLLPSTSIIFLSNRRLYTTNAQRIIRDILAKARRCFSACPVSLSCVIRWASQKLVLDGFSEKVKTARHFEV